MEFGVPKFTALNYESWNIAGHTEIQICYGLYTIWLCNFMMLIFLNPGISGRGVHKVNTLPIEISDIEKYESTSGSDQFKLERSKTESRHRHYSFRSEEAAQIFDDKISVHQKVPSANHCVLFSCIISIYRPFTYFISKRERKKYIYKLSPQFYLNFNSF